MSRLIDADALKDWLEIVPLTGDGGVDINDLVEHIDLMPTAREWIPCSERTPKEEDEYICTMEDGQVQECGFVPRSVNYKMTGWSTCEADGFKLLRDEEILAWMPLPEPYEDSEE